MTKPPTTQTIETTLGALAAAEPALRRLMELRLPVKTAYRLAKLGQRVAAEAAQFHAQQNADIRALGVERDPTEAEAVTHGPGKVISVTPANQAEFEARMAELTALPVTLPGPPIALDDLGDVQVAAADLLALGPLVEGCA